MSESASQAELERPTLTAHVVALLRLRRMAATAGKVRAVRTIDLAFARLAPALERALQAELRRRRGEGA